ncbi:hypothetical protein SLS62_000781 [Diatrype stigma]|uniref:AB hydrolase-1 domain-containing protein n=1 Tax=Diatrype stigma TaxID=117547 RepID=A0AAN9YWI7_9PEZI
MKSISGILSTLAIGGLLLSAGASAQSDNGTIVDAPQDGDVNGSNFTYPWPVKLYRFTSQLQQVEMAFMDVPPLLPGNNSSNSSDSNSSDEPKLSSEPELNDGSKKKVAVLLHGKNFCGATWEGTARRLAAAGYRVIMPDQVGFCKSTKPERYQFSLQQLCANTRGLLQALDISRPSPGAAAVADSDNSDNNIVVIGHSLGGMTAARCALLYPDLAAALVLVNPLGLEDWRALGVPYRTVDALYATERATNYTTIRAYEQETYYPNATWRTPEYDAWARMLAGVYGGSRGAAFALDMALTTDMALAQPVVYEFPRIRPQTLLLVGERDVTALGKQWSPPEVQARLGRWDVLGERAAAAIPDADLVEFPDLGHAPQIQAPERFHAELLGWLERKVGG